jgi:ABC-type uncharacterized transport system substrate-binding protein
MTKLPRRQLVAGFMVVGAELLSRSVLAQSARLFKIGALSESWGPTPAVVGLRDGLQELGYREDKDFTIGVRFTEGKVAELPAAARALVRHGVDIIVTTESGPTAKAAQMATNQIPIVVIGSGDPVGLGLPARVGGERFAGRRSAIHELGGDRPDLETRLVERLGIFPSCNTKERRRR